MIEGQVVVLPEDEEEIREEEDGSLVIGAFNEPEADEEFYDNLAENIPEQTLDAIAANRPEYITTSEARALDAWLAHRY